MHKNLNLYIESNALEISNWNPHTPDLRELDPVNIIGPLYHSTTKKKNHKPNDVFLDSKINNKSQNTGISLVVVYRFDLGKK